MLEVVPQPEAVIEQLAAPVPPALVVPLLVVVVVIVGEW